MVWLAPTGMAPSAHGNAVVQAPLLERSVSVAGTESLTVTPDASDGPALVTVMVYWTCVPGVAVAGPVRVTDRSPDGASADTAEALSSLPGLSVGEEVVALTVFTSGSGAV